MEFIFATIGTATLVACGVISWHLLTDDDDCRESCDFDYVACSITGCRHPNIGQHDGECHDCGELIEIGGSE